MKFERIASDPNSKARAGSITTDHGVVETPIFMPVGTAATVKGVHQRDLEQEINPDIILGNTYHLYLRPQTDIIEKAGGLHKFMNWKRPILTDSGGYQVYSLSANRKIKEEGVKFKSHVDGSYHFFTPENVIDIQRKIGADIIMAFDECTPYPCDYRYAKRSMHMTHRWLERCLIQNEKSPFLYDYTQTFFPIVQGSTYKDLRLQSAEYIASKGAEGNAIGGLSVGEPAEEMYAMTEVVCSVLPEDKPRYLMGVGTPINLLENVALGVDMFDCVMPTRNARNGMLFTAEGTINIKNKKWEDDFSMIDPAGYTFVDTDYSKAYLRHLFKVNEMLGKQIATIHNLGFYLWLMREARKRIIAGDFYSWKEKMVKNMDKRL
ncbi:tRNA guanosine(34) transglycosylase Tgt [Flavobacteriaceae bacterium]|uniref:tRNA guanosine(34) transglycosylase Tgt n=1 Tax=Candidatus Arcticimaribacter forsetii TaxID=2820661 RepID=UPI002076F33A|nr:tRNA guanosine(34) transglycosylase Tgt [Candidatus Arcticimaribacter forsetii]MDB2330037.1 tRNA guanosine(34) transglycosylase Tgt [Flavobacteriaceae bacterium]MDB4643194.1 tRNA guanosine(34) transglycosylase Tgt [Flavobacteriaceae bacterium]MDB4674189.1 tRNA guanosine(34) transglycosylase Tgt [Flavobacteriaceae bacterium]MDB4738121.1 tRNA guanosine(34) transglycosylase Tgt [Flavobacteriaceae bacterium]MDC0960504.1 tRNA guanosine(34) transglycosylase Tgt [Flavobacteriaceae bacterium]